MRASEFIDAEGRNPFGVGAASVGATCISPVHAHGKGNSGQTIGSEKAGHLVPGLEEVNHDASKEDPNPISF